MCLGPTDLFDYLRQYFDDVPCGIKRSPKLPTRISLFFSISLFHTPVLSDTESFYFNGLQFFNRVGVLEWLVIDSKN